jgi:hypothetical protein
MEVKLDTGHTIHASEWDLIPEDFLTAPSTESEKVAKSQVRIGDRIRLEDGRRGRVTRFAGNDPGSPYDEPHMVHVAVDGDLLGVGVDVSLSDVLLDDDDVMLFPGSIRVATEARPASDLQQVRKVKADNPVATIVDMLQRGENVTLPAHLRDTCEKYPLMQKLISIGRIRFQEVTFS